MQLIQSVDDKKRQEEEAKARKIYDEEKRVKEEEYEKRKAREEEEYKKQNFCAWHSLAKANYTCEGCGKRFCYRCLGQEEGKKAYCKGCWSSLKYKVHIEGKTKGIVKEKAVKSETMEIIDSLNGSSPEEMIRKIRQLGADKSSETVKALIDKLGHEDERVRAESAKSLGKIGDTRAVIPLCNRLADSSENVRKTCVLSIGFLKDTRALTHLEQLTYIERDESVKTLIEESIEILRKIQEEKAYELIRKLATEDWQERTRIIEEIVKLGSVAVMPLIKILGARNPNMVLSALEVLSTLGDKKAVPSVISLLNSPEENIRVSAVDALGRFKDESAVPDLIGLRDDISPQVRLALINALSFYPSEEIIDTLINGLFDEDEKVRNKAIDVMKSIDLPEIAPGMVRVLIVKKELRTVAFEILEKKGSYAIEEMGSAIQECEDEEAIKLLLELLALTGDKSSINHMKELSKKKTISKELKGAAKDSINKLSRRLGLGIGDTFSRFMRTLNKKYEEFSSKAQKKVSAMSKKDKKEVLPTCSVCNKVIRKQYPELKGEIVWQLENRSYCKKCGELYCPKCARKSEMGMGTTLISCPKCKKEPKD